MCPHCGLPVQIRSFALADISIYAQIHCLYTALDREIDGKYTHVHRFLERMMKATGVSSIKEVA